MLSLVWPSVSVTPASTSFPSQLFASLNFSCILIHILFSELHFLWESLLECPTPQASPEFPQHGPCEPCSVGGRGLHSPPTHQPLQVSFPEHRQVRTRVGAMTWPGIWCLPFVLHHMDIKSLYARDYMLKKRWTVLAWWQEKVWHHYGTQIFSDLL